MNRMKDGLGPGTIAARAGAPPAEPAGPLVVSPEFATAYHQDLDDVAPVRYGRWGHRSADHLEEVLGALDRGRSVVFNSGMAAVSAVLLALLRPSDRLVLFEGGTYYETRQIADQLAGRGIEVQVLKAMAELPAAVVGARLVVVESPSNPLLDLYDLREIARIAHAAGALVAVDNSVASPLGQCPLDLGADLAMCSDAKVVGGHHDLVLGHVSSRDAELLTALQDWRYLHGGIPSAFTCWLALRSIGTLELRVQRQNANAGALVKLLATRPEVTGLRWPGSPADPQYPLAARQMMLGGGLLAFRLPGRPYLHRFLRASRLIVPATSYGGLQSTANDIGAWPHLAVPAGLVRISCGCEDTADLVDDVRDALDKAAVS
ncbi:aminotransferase class I/II-fold pyridoxal phosphate-dependent enzyme [Kribbella qitaiheensis]|uniref:Aminotransferase class I/II-fold pyridoxal phosphate-dependent enzyme n=1 Tax=Kribbella qitaiheensis TaxID=1544730 RepID=A0A7G6WU00_9ACTN|nr:aminotransferase class I/II-fold pyridoxal phosphate-dependent enzyme [Kribbella qitaiheensis]QNE17465.1 aminotransferase class I/II-fold pyridoxal phosphate-dependent enzyme [Kribbella qitaiheensis]